VLHCGLVLEKMPRPGQFLNWHIQGDALIEPNLGVSMFWVVGKLEVEAASGLAVTLPESDYLVPVRSPRE
jgi:hypothetical protein